MMFDKSDNLGEDLKQLRETQFHFILLQKKSPSQLKEFISMKAVEMRLNPKRVREILNGSAALKDFAESDHDATSKLMQAMLDVYFKEIELARINYLFKRTPNSLQHAAG